MGKYDDIINLEHFEPKNHKRMSTYQRAAQFSPFAALTGYDDLVNETIRITHDKIELSEYEKSLVNEKLVNIKIFILCIFSSLKNKYFLILR